MNVQDAPTPMTESREQHSPVRLQGRWLLLARGLWVTLVILTLAIFFASLPMYLAQLQAPCSGTACQYQQLTHSQAEMLKGIGMSLGDYTAYTLVLALANMILCLVVSTLIVWHRSNDRMAMLVALMLVTLGPISVSATFPPSSPSPWLVPNTCLIFLFTTLLVLVFLLFPSGQFVPRWMRWTLIVVLTGLVPTAFVAPAFPPNTLVDQLTSLVSLSEVAILAILQLYRYRRVSSPLQRQQTKWVVFGIAVAVTVPVSGSVLLLIFPALAEPGSLFPVVLNVVSTCMPLFIPLSFGFAMLRSRLWDIDVLINRTLVYGTLTAILALVYAGLIFALQYLLRGIINQNNDVAIVISTLAIAALFRPLRHRIQRIIDRRFYRRKYDAVKTLEAFSTTLRNEVDLNQLREHLLGVVQETMQPAHISLWLRPPEPSGKQKTWLLARRDEDEKAEC